MIFEMGTLYGSGNTLQIFGQQVKPINSKGHSTTSFCSFLSISF
eukprot:UN20852